MALSKEERIKVAREKTKIRRSGPSFLGKAGELGIKGDTFSLGFFWERTHKEFRWRMHLPEGWTMPDINSTVCGSIRITPAQSSSPGTQVAEAPGAPAAVAAPASNPVQAASSSTQKAPGPHKSQPRTRQKSNRVEKPQQSALRRSARQRARLHASEALESDPYEFTGTPAPATQPSNQDAEAGIPRSPDTGAGRSRAVNPAQGSGSLSAQDEAENESLHPSGDMEAAQEAADDVGMDVQGGELQSDAPGEIDFDALASATAGIAHMSDETFGPLQSISSPFGSSSWMDIDFLGDLPNDAGFNDQDVQGLQQELQQGSDIPQPAVMGLHQISVPRPGPNMAWWRLAQESMSLLRNIIAPQKEIF